MGTSKACEAEPYGDNCKSFLSERAVITDSRTYVPKKTTPLSQCCVKGCRGRLYNSSHQFFGFPVHNRDRCKQWLLYCDDETISALSISALSRRKVCERHFTEDSFERIIKRGLTKDAVPTIPVLTADAAVQTERGVPKILSQDDSSPATGGDSNDLTLTVKSDLPDALERIGNLYQKCSFIGCQSSKDSDPSLQFFWFPKDPNVCKQWIINCGDKTIHTESKLSMNLREVCEKHFTKDSFETIIERTLKEDAIPTVPLDDLPTKDGDVHDSMTIPKESADQNPPLTSSLAPLEIRPQKDFLKKSDSQEEPESAAFMRYSRMVWGKVKAQNPKLNMWGLGKIVGQMWRDLPVKNKAEFFEDVEDKKEESADQNPPLTSSLAPLEIRPQKGCLKKPDSVDEPENRAFMRYSRLVWGIVKAQNPKLRAWGIHKIVDQMWCDLPVKYKAEFFEDVEDKKKLLTEGKTNEKEPAKHFTVRKCECRETKVGEETETSRKLNIQKDIDKTVKDVRTTDENLKHKPSTTGTTKEKEPAKHCTERKSECTETKVVEETESSRKWNIQNNIDKTVKNVRKTDDNQKNPHSQSPCFILPNILVRRKDKIKSRDEPSRSVLLKPPTTGTTKEKEPAKHCTERKSECTETKVVEETETSMTLNIPKDIEKVLSVRTIDEYLKYKPPTTGTTKEKEPAKHCTVKKSVCTETKVAEETETSRKFLKDIEKTLQNVLTRDESLKYIKSRDEPSRSVLLKPPTTGTTKEKEPAKHCTERKRESTETKDVEETETSRTLNILKDIEKILKSVKTTDEYLKYPHGTQHGQSSPPSFIILPNTLVGLNEVKPSTAGKTKEKEPAKNCTETESECTEIKVVEETETSRKLNIQKGIDKTVKDVRTTDENLKNSHETQRGQSLPPSFVILPNTLVGLNNKKPSTAGNTKEKEPAKHCTERKSECTETKVVEETETSRKLNIQKDIDKTVKDVRTTDENLKNSQRGQSLPPSFIILPNTLVGLNNKKPSTAGNTKEKEPAKHCTERKSECTETKVVEETETSRKLNIQKDIDKSVKDVRTTDENLKNSQRGQSLPPSFVILPNTLVGLNNKKSSTAGRTKEKEPAKHCTETESECTEMKVVEETETSRKLNIQKDIDKSVKDVRTTDENLKNKEEDKMSQKSFKTEPFPPTCLFADILKSWSLFDNLEPSDLPSQNEVTVKSTSKPLPTTEDKNDETCNSNFSSLEVITPVRTYKRTTPKRPRPADWGPTGNKEKQPAKIIKTDTFSKPPSKSQPVKIIETVTKTDTSSKTISESQPVKIIKTDTSSNSLSEEQRNILDFLFVNRNEKMQAELNSVMDSVTSFPTAVSIKNITGSTRTAKPSLSQNLHSCLYCNQLTIKMKQHLVEKHLDEEEVNITFSLSKDAKEKELILITRVGDFRHNIQVMKESTGLLICLGGNCHDISTFENDMFMPCPDCTGFVHVSKFSLHRKKCLFKDKLVRVPVERDTLVESRAMLAYFMKYKFRNLKSYFSKRLESPFGLVANNDELIMLLVPYLFSNTKCQDASAILVLLRRMGCILYLYRRIAGDQKIQFQHIFRPESLQFLFKALDSFFSQTIKNERVGLYKCIYSHISLSAFMWRGKCLMEGNFKSAMEALQFFYLFTNLYEKELSTADLIQEQLLDLSSETSESTPLAPVDIVRFKNSLNERIVRLMKEVVSKESVKYVWHDLAAATMCLLSLTNPVDFSAIEGLKLAEYAVRPDRAVDDLTKYKNVIPFFCRFSEKHAFVCTEYLGNEIVLLLPPILKRAIDILIKRRKEAGIPLLQPNVFSGCYDVSLSAVNSFYNLCIKGGGIFSADVLREVSKRQYISHIIHISDMSPGEIELAKNYLKSSLSDKKPFLLSTPEGYYDSEIEKAFMEALHTYEVNQGSVHGSHNPSEDSKHLNPKVMMKSNETGETHLNTVGAGSTQCEPGEIKQLSPSGTKEDQDASKTSTSVLRKAKRMNRSQDNISVPITEIVGKRMCCKRVGKVLNVPQSALKIEVEKNATKNSLDVS